MMKTTRTQIILNGLMAIALMATAGCWTQHGSQPGGGGQAGFSAFNNPIKTSGVIASSSAQNNVSNRGTQLTTKDRS